MTALVVTPEELLNLYIAHCIGQELPERGVLELENLSEAQVQKMGQVLDFLKARYRAMPVAGGLQ